MRSSDYIDRFAFLIEGNARPEIETLVLEDQDEENSLANPWVVVLFNDEIHTFEEVISQLIKATKCTPSQAELWAWTVHSKGKVAVFEGDFEECLKVSGILKEIQLVVEIQG